MFKKIPGFGTGKKWKTFVATLFYLTTIIVFLNPIGVTSIDKIIFVFSYLVIFGIPFIILLNLWSIRSRLPFFRDNTIKKTIIGVTFTFVLVTGVVASASAFISPEQKRIDQNAAQQAEEEQKIKTEDKKAAKNLDNKILGLGKVDNLDLSKAGEIAKLFQDYESLTSSQKDYVTKYDVLISAEKKIKDLESEKLVAEKAAVEKAAVEKAAAEKAAVEKAAAEKAAAEKAAAEKAAAEKEVAEKAAAEKAAAEKAAANPAFFENILSGDLYKDFVKALEVVGISPAKVKNLKQIDDWVAGSRYSFVFDGMDFLVYTNMDSTVETIKYGLNIDLYKKGYEPHNISDYYFDDSLYSILKIKAEDRVKSTLNYPNTAKFSWLGWGRSRDHDLYSLSNTVKAKNAFGVEEEIPFYVTYHIENDNAKLVYFEMNSSIVVDELDTVKVPERKLLASDEKPDPSTEGKIILIDGELGKYGKNVTINGNEYIHYYIPEGTYFVTNQSEICKVYVAKDKLITNSDGYKESKIVQTITFTVNGQTDRVTVKSDEHIILTIYATVTLEKE